MKKECLVKNLALGIVFLFIGVNITSLVESLSIKDNSGISLITIQVEGELGLNNWYTSDVDFSFTKESEDIASIYYNTNNEWNEYIEPFIISDDGEHTLKWYAINYEGNTSDVDGPFFFNIDQTKPTISLTYEVTGGNPEHGWEFTFTATATDSASGMDRVEFFQNNVLQYTANGPGPTYVWVMLYYPAPNIFFKVIGYDKAGNSDIDCLLDPTNKITLKSSRFFSGISKKTNIQTFSNNVLPSEIVKLENHKIIEKLPSSYTNEDVFDPASVIVVFNRKFGGNSWIVSNVSISICVDDKIAEFFYQINDGGWNVYTGPMLIVISDDGEYVFSWYVVDSEGYSSTPGYFNFKIDQTPPEINIIKQRIAINKVKFIANVYDSTSNIDRVKFSIYYTSEFTDYAFPYEWIWTGFLNKIVTATVYDKAGNSNSCSKKTWNSRSYSQQVNQLLQNLILRHQMRNM